MKRQVLAIILVALMILPPILSSGIDIFLARAEKREKNIMVQLNTPDSQGRIVLKPIDTEILENKPEATISGVETVKASGITWTNPPGTWWDTDWEYRINVTVTEPEVVDRVDWPVDIYVTFDPPAYKYSIRVIDASSFQEIPSQIWNVTYYNSSHLTAATVTFLVNLAKGASKVYQIYWSVDFTDPPNYSKRISITAESTAYGDKYIITSKIYGWGIEIPATNGGKAANITLPNGNKIGADWLHFGPTRQPTFSYLGYWGTGDTNNARYENRYIYGTGDTLLELYQGVIFVTYVVEGVPLYDSTRQNDTAKVDFSYRIFDRYILVNEKIAWLIDDSGVDYFVGGWVFDQDDGLGDSTFNCVANDTSYIYKPSETVTFSGSITNPNGRSFRGSTNIPLLAVYRVYWTAGTHTVDLTNFYYNGDDTYIYVYDEAGNLIIRDYDYNQPSSYSITVNTDGYYYIALGSYGDDNRDGFVEFDVAIDGVTVDTDVRVGDFDTRDGYTVHPASIMMHAITIPANAETCTVDLLWTDDTQNLDLFLYGPPGSNSSMANVLYSSEATTGTEEKIVFTPTIAGNYTILVYKNSGSEVATTYTLYATLGNAFEINDYYSLDTLDHVAFLHNGTGNGIGYVFLGDRSSGVTFTSASLIWYNDGNDSEKDYVYTTRLYRGVTATTGSALEVSYSVIPFNATAASVDSSYAIFKDLKSAIKNPLQTSKNVKERFKIVTKVKVVDNDNSAVRGVTIEFINSTGQVEYSATTNASGYAVLDIVRKSYTIKATLTSGGITQTTSVNKDYSTYSYDILSDDVLITFTGIIRFRLQALTNRSLEGPKEYIQSARIVLSNSTHVIDTQTNLTGWIDLYLSIGSWTIAFNATSTATPDPWDTISIYNDSALLPDNRTAGPSENVTITLTKGWIYYLVDHDVTEAPPATKLSLFNTLTFYDVYWGETVKIQVNFTRTDAGEGIDGEVRWYVINSSGGAELSGIATKQTIGGFSFEVNTSNLDAGEYYTILVNGTPADPSFLLPSPITVGLSVKERPTALDVSFNPPGPVIYWNESLSITTIFSDSILGTGITGASVEVIIYATQTIVIPLNDLGDGSYTATVKTVLESLDAGSYLLVVRASKKNYVLNEKSFTLIINARPTTIYYDNYIEIPWQSLYTITIHYIDDRFSEEIADADVRYVLKEAATGNIILGPSQMSFPGTAWIASLDLTQVDEGSYIIEIFAGKKNYENHTATITFVIKPRTTTVQPSDTKLSVYYDENIYLTVTYYDMDFNQYVTGATAQCYIAGIEEGMPSYSISLLDLSNGTYLLNISASTLGVEGGYTITITLSKQHYEPATVYVSLTIKPIPTTATASKTTESIEWGLNTSIRITYNDSRTGAGIEADTATFTIKNETWTDSGDLVPIAPGVYMLDIDTIIQGLVPGTYTITVTLSKPHYVSQTIVITLTVTEVKTYAYAQPANVTLYWGETAESKAYYIRSRDSSFLETTPNITILDTTNNTYISVGVTIILDAEYYSILIDATKLSDGHIYAMTIAFSKPYHRSATVTLYIKVLPIPVTLSVVPPVADITWGDDYNFTITLINALNQSGLEGLTPVLLVYLGGEKVDVGTAITWLEVGDGVYIILVKSGLLNTTVYSIYVAFAKPHYAIPSVNVTARIKPVSVSVSVRTTKDVKKNPATGTATTRVEVILRESTTGAPISGATIYVLVMRGEEEIMRIQAQESTEEPGVYVVYIDWSKVEPGDYTIRVLIETIQRKGYVGSAETTVTVAEGVTETGVRVDYLGGSTVIAGKRYPNLIIYPILLIVFVAAGFIGYRYYSWIKLPIEVREVIRLMKAVEKGVYEYPAPTREEAIKEVLAKQLGLE